MTGKSDGMDRKNRILFLKRHMEEHTDELHPIAMPKILEILESEGIPASRKTVARDLEQLAASGVDLVCNTGHHHEYFIGERHFELPELKLLIDAVSASGFISAKKSALLIRKLTAFSSRHQEQELSRHLYVDKRIKTENERAYLTVDLLHTAINAEKQVSFKYYEYDRHKKKVYKHRRYDYLFSPYALLWNSDRYYTVGYSEKHGKVIAFRVDRIAAPKLTGIPATPKPADYDIAMYTKSIFQMFEGAGIEKVTLKCENDLMKSVIDRFGEEIETEILDEGHFSATADVSISPTFFGWVFSFGGRMKIISPESAVSEYRHLAKHAFDL